MAMGDRRVLAFMDSTIGTPFTDDARRLLLCGAGELGKEVVIELQRYGVDTQVNPRLIP